MQRHAISPETEAIGRSVIDAGLRVHSVLGAGLLESAYEHCLAQELARRSIAIQRQMVLPIRYENITLDAGYRIDLLAGAMVLIEVKSVNALTLIHQAQLLTYLKLSNCRLGFLMNFNVRLFRDGLNGW